jgi:hypothetical protein
VNAPGPKIRLGDTRVVACNLPRGLYEVEPGVFQEFPAGIPGERVERFEFRYPAIRMEPHWALVSVRPLLPDPPPAPPVPEPEPAEPAPPTVVPLEPSWWERFFGPKVRIPQAKVVPRGED